MTPERQGAAPGWYPTPDGQQRYWDGRQWTQHVAPLANPGPYVARQQPYQAAARPDMRPWYAKKRFILPVVGLGFFFLLGILGSLVPDPPPSESAQSVSSSTRTSSAAPASTATPTPEDEPPTSEPTVETEEAVEEPAEEAPMVVTAKAMLDELEANALAASNKYKGKRVTVTGILDNIDASGDYFSLVGDEFTFITDITVNIDESHLDTVSGFTMGQEVTVTGVVTGVGEIMGYDIEPESLG